MAGTSRRSADKHAATERILDAAGSCFVEFGTRRTTMNQVADAAGLGVATVYRRFPQKAELVRAVVLRDAMTVMAEVALATSSTSTIEDHIVEGFVAFAIGIKARPLLGEVASGDADLANYIGEGDGWIPILDLGRTFLGDLVRDHPTTSTLTESDIDVISELLARLALSLVLVPEGVIELDDHQAARSFAQRYLVPLLSPR